MYVGVCVCMHVYVIVYVCVDLCTCACERFSCELYWLETSWCRSRDSMCLSVHRFVAKHLTVLSIAMHVYALKAQTAHSAPVTCLAHGCAKPFHACDVVPP